MGCRDEEARWASCCLSPRCNEEWAGGWPRAPDACGHLLAEPARCVFRQRGQQRQQLSPAPRPFPRSRSHSQLQPMVGAGGPGTNQSHHRTSTNDLQDRRGQQGLQLRDSVSLPSPHLTPSGARGPQLTWRHPRSRFWQAFEVVAADILRCFGHMGEPTHQWLAPSLPATEPSGTHERNLLIWPGGAFSLPASEEGAAEARNLANPGLLTLRNFEIMFIVSYTQFGDNL